MSYQAKKILLQKLEKGKTVQISASYPCDPTSNPLLLFPHSSFFSATVQPFHPKEWPTLKNKIFLFSP